METVLDITVLFTFVLALALLIERFLELLKSFYDLLDGKFNWHTFWTKRAKRLRNKLERKLKVFEYVDARTVESILNRFREIILNEKGGYRGTVPVISGDLVRAVTVRSGLKIIGIFAGIALALRFGIDIVTLWELKPPEDPLIPLNLRIAFSGTAIGLGSGPVHKIITTIEKRRAKQREKRKGGKP